MNKNSRLVYSTDQGRIKPEAETEGLEQGDGIVRLHRETKGRKGKGVTLIKGLALPAAELKVVAKKLKHLCGTGGSVKDQTIEIQGDQREIIKAALEKQGHQVKIAGA